MGSKGILMGGMAALLALALTPLACGPKATPQPTPAAPPAKAPPAATPAPAPAAGDTTAGKAVFQAQGCPACHAAQGQGGAIGPSLDGLFGKKVKLVTGQEVTADEAYIRESILNPTAKVAAGFQPIMPATYASMPPKDLDNIVAFIRCLAK